ncbi:hypothetical protein GCM10007913_42490 [Devosia yakushimensis]|uniref:Uncharacterized protein n=1 Tax=Devosia yakushimensis TaxID=470028 RepID=A0ABQ5UK07_9HYPH|nr:hypothetical protein [Devosia yakushimensis]GLQ12316.1 hypothetical protein GCM10007913_42490 [Devosia yakushimensis]
MTTLFSQNISVQYGQAYLELGGQFNGSMEDCFRGQSNGICGASAPDLLFLITGLHTGKVGLTINLFDTDPGIDETWDEIVEVSCQAPKGEVALSEWAADSGPPMAVPAGSYRARYHARKMQAANELDTNVTEVPVDTYRLDLWPAPPAADRIIKQTSEVAAYWHGWAKGLAMGK